MFKLADRVKETTLTQGTGTLTLTGSFGSFQTFLDGIGDGNSTYYTIENGSNFEIGIGTLSSNTLSRTTILSSSNGNNKINLSGVSLVFCTYPASCAVFLNNSGLIDALSPQYSGIVFPDSTTISTSYLSGIIPELLLPSGLVYTDDSRLSDDRYPLPHSHIIIDVSGLQNSLDNKQPSGNYSVVGHGHSIGDVGGLQTALDGKQPSGSYANLSHTHLIADVSGLQTSLDSKQPSGSYANLSHTHLIADVSGLQTSLDSKQPSGNYLTSHPSVSAASSSDNSGNTFIQDLLFDSYGHVTGISTSTANSSSSVSISNYTNNRLLTSDGTSSGIYAENKLTFDGSELKLDNAQVFLEYNDPENDPTFFRSNQITPAQINLVSEYSVSTGVYNSAGMTSEDISIAYNEQNLDIPIQTSYSTSITKNNLSFYKTLYDNTNAGAELSSSIMTVNSSGIIFTDASTLDSANHNHSIVNVSGLQTALDSKQPSGSYASLSHTHLIVDVSGLQASLDSKQPSGNYAASSHTHTSSNITDFNSSVSGLLPVKDITSGYDISIVNTSGSYSIASTNLVHVDSKQPQGFINRTDSRISVSGNIFTIAPTGSSYSFYNQGIKVTKTAPESITIPSGLTQINYIHFNIETNVLDNKTTAFDFNTDIPVAFISWNGGINPSGEMTFFAEERHGIVMDTSTHRWIHNTFGAQYINGLSISNYSTSGNGSSNSHATIAISDGTLYQEDIEINITDSSSTDPFCQELSPIAQIPVYYHQGSTGQWVKNTATDYPVKYGANGPQYNLLSGGTWTIPDVSSGGQTRYFAVWILATNQIDDPIISIMGQRIDSNPGAAESNNNWADVNLTNLPLNEVKPLYRLIFAGDSDFTNTPKCYLYSILDLRATVISSVVGIPQNDHGSLFGLADDDHGQYVHIDNARTINAVHTLVNGIAFDGSGTQTSPYLPAQVNITGGSGDFSSLKLNSTIVSVSGHTHISSNITDFNSSVSGLLPVKDLIAGTNIQISSTSGNYTISVSGISGGGSSSASDLTSGTLNDARLSFTPIHPFLLFGG